MGIRDHVFRVAVALCWAPMLATPASAQTGRLAGMVRDQGGNPIKGATVVAENPSASPNRLSTTTDDKGRFSMLGLRGGTWALTASAPGFVSTGGAVPVRTLGGPNPPLEFTLARSGPAGALAGVNTTELQAALTAADGLLASGQYDEAIAAYRALLAKTPALTTINIQIGRAFRGKKDYVQALAAYDELLRSEPQNELARVEAAMAHVEKGDLPAADAMLSEAAAAPDAGRDVFYALGEVQFARSDVDRAARSFQRASELDRRWAKPLLKLALIQLNRGDRDGCAAMLEQVRTVEPDSAEATQATALLAQLEK